MYVVELYILSSAVPTPCYIRYPGLPQERRCFCSDLAPPVSCSVSYRNSDKPTTYLGHPSHRYAIIISVLMLRVAGDARERSGRLIVTGT